jgi:tRNA-splicing ligase RtcB
MAVQITARCNLADHKKMTTAVECRNDAEVIEEAPAAEETIEAVTAAQRELMEIVRTWPQMVCPKG